MERSALEGWITRGYEQTRQFLREHPDPDGSGPGKITVQAPDGSFIDMTNYGPNPSVFTVPEFEGVQRGLRDVYDIGRIGVGIPTCAERIND